MRAPTGAPVRPAAAIPATVWGASEIRGPVHLFREGLLLRLLCRRLAEGRVVDAGCGSGSLALALARAGFRVEAVERSGEFAARVRDKAARYGAETWVRVCRASVARLPFAGAAFDGAVCGEVLEHLRAEEGGDEAAVAELRRVLRPGGTCVVSVPLNMRLWDEADLWAGHVKRYERSELVALLEGGGFGVEEVRVWGFPLGRLYHRLLFGPWMRRTAHLAAEEREGRADTRAAGNRRLVAAAAGLLRVDELFGRWQLGRGVIAVATRR